MTVNWLIRNIIITQQTFTGSKSTIDKLENRVNYVQS